MTRAKEKVYFFSVSSFKSKFIKIYEIKSVHSPINEVPVFKTQDVVLKKLKK